MVNKKIPKGWYLNQTTGKYEFGVYNSAGVVYAPFDEDGLKLAQNEVSLPVSRTIATKASPGVKGTICWDASYIYVCTATNTWKRVAISNSDWT